MDFSYLDDWQDEEEAEAPLDQAGEGYRNIWVVAEATGGVLHRATLEAMGQARELADQIGVYVYALLLGDGVEPLGQQLVAFGADKVLLADHPDLSQYQPETYVEVLADLVAQYRPEILLLPATALGNDLAPRLAGRLDTGLATHCIRLDLDMSQRLLLCTVPTLGGEVHHTYACPDARPQMATLQPGFFPTPYEDAYRSGDLQLIEIDVEGTSTRLTWLDMAAPVELAAPTLSSANIVVSAGRGMCDAEGFALVEQLAEALGGVVAGSRGAFDEGWIAEDRIVGVGGEFIAPDLYIACGVSGDIFHYFGVQDAKFVVAINHDLEAPIMKLANLAVAGDASEIIPAMLAELAG
jgi:electron transfer flavoprotein alpha subunit